MNFEILMKVKSASDKRELSEATEEFCKQYLNFGMSQMNGLETKKKQETSFSIASTYIPVLLNNIPAKIIAEKSPITFFVECMNKVSKSEFK